MAKRLKLSLMIHIEEGTRWNQTDALQTVDARRIGALASIVGGGSRGAKLSLQMDYPFVDCSDVVVSTPYSAPSSLRWVTDHGGNFWCHTHDSSYNHLTSVQRTVASAYAAEAGYSYPTALNLTAGRSGGPDINDPALDWASITVHAGIRRMNSTAVNYSSTLPASLRPYGMTDEDMAQGGLYFHETAPGPIDPTVPTTMRQRPFWFDAASAWDAHVDSTFPHVDQVSSIMMIPHPGRHPVEDYAGNGELSVDDFNAALTEIWTTAALMDAHQSSIINVWYMHIPPAQITSKTLETFGAWVDSVNGMLNNGGDPRGQWLNMNEIASLYGNPTSFYW